MTFSAKFKDVVLFLQHRKNNVVDRNRLKVNILLWDGVSLCTNYSWVKLWSLKYNIPIRTDLNTVTEQLSLAKGWIIFLQKDH